MLCEQRQQAWTKVALYHSVPYSTTLYQIVPYHTTLPLCTTLYHIVQQSSMRANAQKSTDRLFVLQPQSLLLLCTIPQTDPPALHKAFFLVISWYKLTFWKVYWWALDPQKNHVTLSSLSLRRAPFCKQTRPPCTRSFQFFSGYKLTFWQLRVLRHTAESCQTFQSLLIHCAPFCKQTYPPFTRSSS